VEAKLVGPDSYHAPTVEHQDTEAYHVEHRFRAKLISLLDGPENIDTDSLAARGQ
jgi:hypothetical protein